MRSTRILATGLAVAVTFSLAGCLHSNPGKASITSPAGHATAAAPSPTPTGLPAGALLRVSAIAAADDGSRVRIVETVSGPTAGDGSEDAAMTAAECSGDGYTWQSDFPGTPQWLHLDMTATPASGSPWPADDDHQIFLVGASGWDTVAWTGSWHHAQAYCASGYAVIPGHAVGVAPVVGDPDARTSWQSGDFGFGWDWGEREDAPPNTKVSFEDCTLELSDMAQAFASRFVRPPADGAYGQPCEFGTRPS